MKDFWQLQLSVIVQLRKLRSLSIVVVFIPVVLDVRPINGFMSGMKKDGWVNIITTLYFPHYGDSVASSIKCLISVHSKTDQNVEPLQLTTPPQINPTALASYIWPRFNTVEYAVSYGKDDQLFNRGAVDWSPSSKRPDISFRISDPKNPVDESIKPHAKVKYFIHPVKGDALSRSPLPSIQQPAE
jgi:hypothetical protein